VRKANREVRDIQTIRSILDQAEYLSLGINTDGYPYVVPLSFGYREENGVITLYFHCAKAGRKPELLERDNRVCAEIAVSGGYVRTDHSVTADYRSVIGVGRAVPVTGEEAVEGIRYILEHCHITGYDPVACAAMGITAVYKIRLEEYSAKKRF
jgi:nitroimidazol reductase NimA-like FMN-containing flavoprotein (pyridoxamine 5'-phosphate oxidase superfamily)